MKTEEETLNKKFTELLEKDMEQVVGGEGSEDGYTVLACDRCGHEITWPGTSYFPAMGYAVDCEKCGFWSYHWVRIVK